MKPRVKPSGDQWLRYAYTMATGYIDFRTGAHIPYVRDGISWPKEVDVWVIHPTFESAVRG